MLKITEQLCDAQCFFIIKFGEYRSELAYCAYIKSHFSSVQII